MSQLRGAGLTLVLWKTLRFSRRTPAGSRCRSAVGIAWLPTGALAHLAGQPREPPPRLGDSILVGRVQFLPLLGAPNPPGPCRLDHRQVRNEPGFLGRDLRRAGADCPVDRFDRRLVGGRFLASAYSPGTWRGWKGQGSVRTSSGWTGAIAFGDGGAGDVDTWGARRRSIFGTTGSQP